MPDDEMEAGRWTIWSMGSQSLGRDWHMCVEVSLSWAMASDKVLAIHRD